MATATSAKWTSVVLLLAVSNAGWAADAAPASSPKARPETSDVRAGLCVLVGCADGGLAADLAKERMLVVHVLAPDPASMDKVRKEILSRGLYGQVSAETLKPSSLPYADSTVNLLLVHDLPGLLSEGLSVKEIVRCLVPGGRVLAGGAAREALQAALAKAGAGGLKVVGSAGTWTKLTKPRPAGMDEWTHNQLHGPDGNPVSQDVLVKPPARNLRWIAGPIWPIGPNRKAGLRGIISAGARNFYLTSQDTANFSVPEAKRDRRVLLVARDAFNGMLLWKRLAGGILVATSKRVFTLPKPNGPLTALDAATGEVLTTYSQARSPGRVIHHEGKLLVSSGGRLLAIDVAGGKTLWEIAGGGRFVIGEGQVLHTVGRGGLAGADLTTGKRRWARPAGFKGYLFCYSDGVLISAGGTSDRKGTLVYAYSAKDGSDLWSHAYGTRGAFHHLSCIQGAVWKIDSSNPKGVYGGFSFVGRDLHTGKVVRQFDFPGNQANLTNVGCARSMATVNYIMGGNPVSFIDPKTGEYWYQWAARNGCGAGQIAANGMIYSLPKSCGCFRTMLRGYTGFATDADPAAPAADAPERLVKGPAFDKAVVGEAKTGPQDWPTFRHDPARSAVAPAGVPAELKPRWQVRVDDQPASTLEPEWAADPVTTGDRLTAPVVAGTTAFLALPQSHRVVALDTADGKQRWSFTTGGRIDTPPTIHEGLCLFGSRDGWAYCLRADTGELVWKYRAAPLDRRIMAFGQLESSWPVTGGVLVDAGLACLGAGRSSVVDGGIYAYALHPRTGKLLWSTHPTPRSVKGDPRTTRGPEALCDLPVSDGKVLAMGFWRLDLRTGKSLARASFTALSAGYQVMDRSWHFTSFEQFGKHAHIQHYGSRLGQLLVPGKDRAYGFVVRNERDVRFHPELQAVTSYKSPPIWTVPLPPGMQMEAVVMAGEALFVAGPVDRLDRSKGGVMWAVSAKDGRKLAEYPLAAPPVAEGLAIAAGRLYLATEDGKLLCFESK